MRNEKLRLPLYLNSYFIQNSISLKQNNTNYEEENPYTR